jgi:hypothetical protein
MSERMSESSVGSSPSKPERHADNLDLPRLPETRSSRVRRVAAVVLEAFATGGLSLIAKRSSDQPPSEAQGSNELRVEERQTSDR